MQWRSTYNQIPKVTSCPPHFSIQEFIAIDNERLIPQQSISSITNIDDIESKLILPPEVCGQKRLQIYDAFGKIALYERRTAFARELFAKSMRIAPSPKRAFLLAAAWRFL